MAGDWCASCDHAAARSDKRSPAIHNPLELQGFDATRRDVTDPDKAEGVGFEPTDLLRGQRFSRPFMDSRKGKTVNHLRLLTLDLAHFQPTDTRQIDPDLDAVIDAWPDLPDAIKAGITAMVQGVMGSMGDAGRSGKARGLGKKKHG